MKIIDISIPIEDKTPLFPGGKIDIKQVSNMQDGDGYNLTNMNMGVHTGTHLDAPLHFIADGKAIDEFTLDRFTGKAQVLEIKNEKEITVEELESKEIKTKYLLFKTTNSNNYGPQFKEDFIYLTEDAAHYLVEKDVELLGIDYLSIEKYGDPGFPVHKLLLGNEIILLEGINLAGVNEGIYTLMAFPLKIAGSEGAPCRAVLIEE